MAVFYKYQYTNKRKNIHPCVQCSLDFNKRDVEIRSDREMQLSSNTGQHMYLVWDDEWQGVEEPATDK